MDSDVALQPVGDGDLRTGLVVRHGARPDWGLGKVVHLDDRHVHVYFKDIVGDPKDAIRTLSRSAHHLAMAEVQADLTLDNLPPMPGGRFPARYQVRLTEQQAVDQFVAKYQSFEDGAYLRQERDYKWRAHLLVAEWLTATEGRQLLSAGPPEKVAQALSTLMTSSNLLAPQEIIALNDGFKNLEGAQAYGAALVAFVDDPAAAAFARLVNATGSLPAEPGRARVLTWPTVTVLPFLAKPAECVLLKPDMTRRMADAFCFDLQYDSHPTWATYQRLVHLYRHLLNRLRPLGARDFIDVQSFIWVVAGSPYMKSRQRRPQSTAGSSA